MHIISDTVEINRIDLCDTTYQISTGPLTHDFIASIEHVGLISSPILKNTADSRFTVVSGFRRIGACRNLGWQQIDARVICGEEHELACLTLAIADNALTRQLNPVEQATAIEKLSKYYPDDIALSRASSKTGLNVNPGLIKKLKKLNTVYDELKDKIAAGIIPFTTALELGECDHHTAIAFSRFIEQLSPTLNHQKEIIRLTKEISRLNDVPMSDVINDNIFAEIIDDPEIDRNQKIRKIRLKLKQIRYPQILRFEQYYAECLQRIHLPDSIHLIAPADFEASQYSMHLKFDNLDQFKDITNVLTKLQDHPDFAKILEKEFEDI